MNLHQLKILECFYRDVDEDRKTFELRKDDRNYKVDDLINFIVIDKKGIQIKTDVVYQIIYILKNVPEYGLSSGYCILGIRRIGKLVSWPGITYDFDD